MAPRAACSAILAASCSASCRSFSASSAAVSSAACDHFGFKKCSFDDTNYLIQGVASNGEEDIKEGPVPAEEEDDEVDGVHGAAAGAAALGADGGVHHRVPVLSRQHLLPANIRSVSS